MAGRSPRAATVTVGCLLAAAALPAVARAQAVDPGIETLRVAYEQAWNKGDANAVAALYTDTALVVNDAGVKHGRAEVVQELKTNLAGPWKGASLTIKLGQAQTLSADATVHEGTYTITGLKTPDGKAIPAVGTAWLIAGHMAFAPPPGTAPGR